MRQRDVVRQIRRRQDQKARADKAARKAAQTDEKARLVGLGTAMLALTQDFGAAMIAAGGGSGVLLVQVPRLIRSRDVPAWTLRQRVVGSHDMQRSETLEVLADGSLIDNRSYSEYVGHVSLPSDVARSLVAWDLDTPDKLASALCQCADANNVEWFAPRERDQISPL